MFARSYRNFEVETKHGEIYPPVVRESLTSGDALAGNWCVTCARILRASHVRNVGGWDESLKTLMDWDLNLKMVFNYPHKTIPDIVSQVNIRADSNSMLLTKKRLYEATPQIKNKYKNHKVYEVQS